jgi:hypothetical protein
MSWNRLLDLRALPRLIAGSQAAKPTLCPRELPTAKVTAKPLRPELSSPAIPPIIPQNKSHAVRKARVPLSTAAALPFKSP